MAGVSKDSAAALSFTKTEKVIWRVALPGPGNSTPVVWGDRIFVTQAIAAENRRTVMCFDRKTGKVLWQKGVTWTEPDPTHATNPHASSSAVTDGKIVVAWFGAAGLFAYDFDGRELWKRDLGKQKHTWGYGTSPVIYEDKVFLNFGPGERSFLAAFDKASGKTLWQVDYPQGKGAVFANWSGEDMYGSWATPLIVKAAGRTELVLSLPKAVRAYDPASGKELWRCEGMGDLVYPTPVLADGVVVAMGGFGGPSLAVRPGGNGDVTESRRVWRTEKSKPMIGSSVVHEGHLFVVDNGGIAHAFEVATGKEAWAQRLQGPGESNAVWSSPVLVGDRVYVMNQGGDVFVFKASPKAFEMLGTSSLGERTNSSVVIADSDLILRTHQALWRIGGR